MESLSIHAHVWTDGVQEPQELDLTVRSVYDDHIQFTTKTDDGKILEVRLEYADVAKIVEAFKAKGRTLEQGWE
jgi:ketosteroid isomerase-like protein